MKGIAMRYAAILVVFLGVSWRVSAAGQEKRLYEDMIKTAGAVVAVEILETDYTATPKDGPMIAMARTLKSLRGPLTTGQQFWFTETAWVGPTYQKGEHRILFLERNTSRDAPKASQWRILSHLYAKDDFFIEVDSIPDLTLESLELFLENIDFPRIRPQGVIFRKGTAKRYQLTRRCSRRITLALRPYNQALSAERVTRWFTVGEHTGVRNIPLRVSLRLSFGVGRADA